MFLERHGSVSEAPTKARCHLDACSLFEANRPKTVWCIKLHITQVGNQKKHFGTRFLFICRVQELQQTLPVRISLVIRSVLVNLQLYLHRHRTPASVVIVSPNRSTI